MNTSPKLDIRGEIRRAQKFQYVNSHLLPPNRTVEAVSYYVRRKQQLTKKQQSQKPLQLPSRKVNMEDLRKEISQSIISQKQIDPYLQNYIREVSIQPVIADNRFTNFKEEDYSLKQAEKVRVVTEKMFPLQNYYNYIYELENKKQITRLVNIVHSIAQKKEEGQHNQEQEHKEDMSQSKRLETVKVKGFYESQFRPRDNYDRMGQSRLQPEQLLPHSDYSTEISKNQVLFIPKEQKRLEMSRRVSQQQSQSRWYY